MNSVAASTEQYTQFTDKEHVLELPGMYIGSTDGVTEPRWVYNNTTHVMEWRPAQNVPGLLKIADEVLVNAADQVVRMRDRIAKGLADGHPVKHIDVTITDTAITVKNDGDGIPVSVHEKTKLWAPELIFGNLRTSANYDKTEEKTVGGKNGYGAKLANIFSHSFTVETVDHRMKKKYVQTWSKNMTVVGKPSVTASSAKPYTSISFTPDLTRFKWEGGAVPTAIPADMMAILMTRVIDIAGCVSKDCKVTLNGAVVGSNTFPKYMDLYLTHESDTATVGSVETEGPAAAAVKAKKLVAYEQAGERWEIGAILTRDLHGETPPDEKHISFVNSIATRRGGKHVEYVSKTVLTRFCELAKKKAKLDVTPAMLKDSVVWFVKSTIVNPDFDAQAKEVLTTPATKFGSTPEISDKFLDQLIKIGLLTEAQALLDAKQARDAKKTDGKKKVSIRGIPKLDDALWAGTARSSECTLILTEGDSAATTAISGRSVVGHERYGVFPLKGKLLNVKDISVAKKTANTELAALKQIIGLETGKDYKDSKSLRYGRIMIMTDQDVDGSHIKGLLMNLFHTDWLSLLKLPFLCCLLTPLLKATKGSQTLCFYSGSEFEAWKLTAEASAGTWKTKYYKGLGTSTAAEAREYFESMNVVEYTWDSLSDTTIDLAFNKKRADDRKEWLVTYDKDKHLPVTKGHSKIAYTQFVHEELKHFSNYDNIRSLPHVMDGLKPSQRKILWSAFKRNLTSEIRVAQLAGYVSETAAYHHGEMSLTGAIVGMAQNFVGSNNLNLLAPNGQFGTRLMGGDDSASPRYIYTQLMPVVRSLIKKEDDAILTYMEDDELKVEPETYLPIVPLVLINGALGIGTGFSTNIPPYNPVDVTGAIKSRLSGSKTSLSDTALTPWWYGFRGTVRQAPGNPHEWITKGLYEFQGDETMTVKITELPVGCWTKDYKIFLDKMMTDQEEAKAEAKKLGIAAPLSWIKSYEEAYTDVKPDFIIYMDSDAYYTGLAYPSQFEKQFKLETSHRTTNMVAFNTKGHIHKYLNTGEILEEFYGKRLDAYGERKAHELTRLATELRELQARLLFVKAVVEKRLVIANVEDEALLLALKGLGLPALSEGEGLKGYEYLLRMRVDRLKASAVAELESEVAKVRASHTALAGTSSETLWLKDLDEFASGWTDYCAWRESCYASSTAAPSLKKKVVRKPKA